MINELMNISMLKIIKLNYSALKGGHYVPGNIFCFMHEYSIVFGYRLKRANPVLWPGLVWDTW